MTIVMEKTAQAFSNIDLGIGLTRRGDPLHDFKLDWQVKKIPLSYTVHGHEQMIPKCALVRQDTYKLLSIVPPKWKPIQNNEFVEIIQTLADQENLDIDLGGSFNEGEYVWLLAKSKPSFTLREKDVIQSYYLFTNPHVYGASFSIQFVPIRMATATSICFSLKAKNHPHEIGRYNFYKDLDSAEKIKGILNAGHARMKEYEKIARFLNSKKYTEEAVEKFLNRIVPTTGDYVQMSRPSVEITKIIESPPEGNMNYGTWWQALNAVFYYFDHMAGNSVDTRMFSNWYGKNRKIKLEAMKIAMSFAEKSN